MVAQDESNVNPNMADMDGKPAFEKFSASVLWCEHCQKAQPVTELETVFACTVCGSKVGFRASSQPDQPEAESVSGSDATEDEQRGNTIPAALKDRPQWVVWRKEQAPKKPDRLLKMPYDPNRQGLVCASTADSATWGTYEQAIEAYERFKQFGCNGIGFVFTTNDEFAGIDLDDCRDPETGELAPWAEQLVTVFNTYTEESPSSTGVHLFLRGKLPGKGRNEKPIEVYDRARYLTVTGNHVDGTPTTLQSRQVELEDLAVALEVISTGVVKFGDRFSLLFGGRWNEALNADGNPYASASEADLALCNLLVAAGATTEAQVMAAIRLSGLYDDKWERGDYQTNTVGKALAGKKPQQTSQAEVVCMADITAVKTDWLWKPYLPLGKLASLEGDPGTGKSQLTTMFAAYITTGRPFPGQDTPREPRNVLFFQEEDGLADTFLPRLKAAGAEVSRVFVFKGAVTVDDAAVEKAIAKYNPALVIIDPIQAYLGAQIDLNKANEIRPIMAQLGRLAEEYHFTILFVRHFAKTQPQKKQENKIYRALGSIDITAACRSSLQVEIDSLALQRHLIHSRMCLYSRVW